MKGTGIYIIENIKNGKCYIGSTAVNFSRRWGNHLNELRKDEHHSIKLQRAFNKYGENSFKFRVLENCVLSENRHEEQEWMDFLSPEYNMLLTVEQVTYGMLGKNHSEETKKKMSKASKGRKKSKSHRKSISEEMRRQWASGQRINGPRSEESKIKQARTRFNGILEVEKNGVLFASFWSSKDASDILKLNKNSINNVVIGKRKSLKKYKFNKKPLVLDSISRIERGFEE